jgi:hypothetical protein
MMKQDYHKTITRWSQDKDKTGKKQIRPRQRQMGMYYRCTAKGTRQAWRTVLQHCSVEYISKTQTSRQAKDKWIYQENKTNTNGLIESPRPRPKPKTKTKTKTQAMTTTNTCTWRRTLATSIGNVTVSANAEPRRLATNREAVSSSSSRWVMSRSRPETRPERDRQTSFHLLVEREESRQGQNHQRSREKPRGFDTAQGNTPRQTRQDNTPRQQTSKQANPTTTAAGQHTPNSRTTHPATQSKKSRK